MAERQSTSGKMFAGIGLVLVGGGCGTWTGVFVLLGVIFTVVFPLAFGLPFDDLRLDRGVTQQVDGEVLGLEWVPNTTINEQSVYTISYSFDAAGQPVQGDARVLEHDAVSNASAGSPLPVEYLEEDPAISRPVGSTANAGGWAGIVGLPFLLLGLLGCVPVALMLGLGIVLVLRAVRARAP